VLCLELGRHRLDFGVGLEDLVAHLEGPASRRGRREGMVGG
jgi:hypothetical protein